MTDPREPSRLLGAADGKLCAVAIVAVVYLIAWYEVSAAPRPTARVPVIRGAVWIDQLPPSARPPDVAPPAGWRVASRDERADAPPRLRTPASRPLRVRTRSS